MHYLFGFSGRINRVKMLLFFLVTFGWELAVALVAVLGLHWTNYLQALQAFGEKHQPFAPAPIPWPDPVTGTDWIGLSLIALLLVMYVHAMLAIYAKRLHDRNKSAWWLIVYVAVPWTAAVFVWASGPIQEFYAHLWAGPMGTARGIAYVMSSLWGLWVFIELYCLPGTKGENRFGPDPLSRVKKTA